MLRHTSIHTYNIPEETNPLSGYVLCVWSEHGRTRLLNTPGGAQRECRQPLFSTLQHRRTQTHLPFPCSFCLRIVSVGVPVMDTVSDLWTFTASLLCSALLCSVSLAPACLPARLPACLPFGQTSGAAAPCFPGAAAAQQATREQNRRWGKTCVCLPTVELWQMLFAKNSDNYPKNNTPRRWQASAQTWGTNPFGVIALFKRATQVKPTRLYANKQDCAKLDLCRTCG